MSPPVTENDFYAVIGRALSAWSEVEHRIGLIFALCVGTPGQEPALRAFWSVHSFEQRLQMATVAVRSNLRDSEPLLKNWKQLAKEFRDANDVRNEIAHGTVVRYDGQIAFCTYLYADIMSSIDGRISHYEIGSRALCFPQLGAKAHAFYEAAARHLDERIARANATRERAGNEKLGRTADAGLDVAQGSADAPPAKI